MTYLRNAWYCAAWSSEIGRSPIVRTIMEEPILLFRKADGSVVAMSDRCPHRYAPLSQGKLVGDVIACPYHGLEFDASGACVLNPHGRGIIPPKAVLRVYPLIERQRAAWIWMGAPDRADESLIPDIPECAEGNGWTTITGYLPVKAHYALVVDNLLDLTHSGYLHGQSVSVAASLSAPKIRSAAAPDGVYSTFLTQEVPAPGPFKAIWKDAICDYHRECRWSAPSQVRTKIGVSPVGGTLDEGLYLLGYHLLTPSSNLTTHYFWSASRRFSQGDAAYDANLRAVVERAFMTEDEPMIASCQRYMGSEPDIYALAPALLETDAPSVMAHRALQKLIREEEAM